MEQKALEQMVLEQKARITEMEKSSKKKPETPAVDLNRVENLITSMERVNGSNIESSKLLHKAIEEARKPVVNRNIHDINMNNKPTAFLVVGLVVAAVFLGLTAYRALQPNISEEDNDLKYRYIKMKGEATPADIAELETFFGDNRTNRTVKALRTKVETFEEAVCKQALADEQARLNQLESQRQKEKAESVKE